MDVRRLRPGEWQQYRAIRLSALLDAPQAFGSTWAAEAELSTSDWQDRARRAADGADRAVYVAVDRSGMWTGLAGGIRPGDPPADVDLVSMWVVPKMRGRAIGQQLVQAVVEWAEASDARTIGLWVTRGNDAALHLYEQSGFRITGDVQPLPSNPCHEELRMLRAISRSG